MTETKTRFFPDDLGALDAAKAIAGFDRLEGWQAGRLVFGWIPRAAQSNYRFASPPSSVHVTIETRQEHAPVANVVHVMTKEQFLEQARQAEVMAETTLDVRAKELWLKVAQQYRELAKNARE